MTRTELHDILYGILCEIDDACRKENVPYCLAGGTLLGAIRHKGFIPWDDDVDITVWQKDYPAMREALRKHLPSHMRLVEPEDLSPYFFDFVVRVQDTRYFWHEPTEEDLLYNNQQNFVCADIFRLVECSDLPLGIKCYAFLHKIIYGMAMAHRPNIDYHRYSGLQKLQVSILALVGRLFKMDTILRMHYAAPKVKDAPRKYAFSADALLNEIGKLMECEWMRETIDVPFRDRMLSVPTHYHERLTAGYGDYMKPPKDKNVYIQHMKFEDN